MTEANQPILVQAAGFLNILGGLVNMVVGLIYIFLCYGIFVIPIGLWQCVAGGMMLTGKRVPSAFASAVVGVVGSVITFNIMGFFLCALAAGLAGYELYGTEPQDVE